MVNYYWQLNKTLDFSIQKIARDSHLCIKLGIEMLICKYSLVISIRWSSSKMCALCFDRRYHFSLFSPQVYSAKKKDALKPQTDIECNYKKNLHFKQQVAIFSGSF